MNMFPNNPVFSLLQQEGYLTRSCLYIGLSAIKRANIETKGDFYVAFFQLSIGLERLMKLTLILDYMATHNLQLPNNKWIRGYSHNLSELVKSVQSIEKRISLDRLIDELLRSETTENQILNFLDEFSQKTRYANLDSLTGKNSHSDPLERWSELTKKIYSSEIPDDVRKQVEDDAFFAHQLLSSNTIVWFSDLEKQSLSLESGWRQTNMFRLAAPFVIWHIMKIIYPIYKVMDDVCGLAQATNRSYSDEMVVPTMYEFFIDFVSNDKEYVLNLEEWLPNA